MASIMIIAGLAVGMAATPAQDSVGAGAMKAPLVLVQSADDNRSGIDCRSAAYRAVEEVGGQLLSVRQSGNECVITVLIPGSGNERPRKVTMRVSN